MVRRARRKIDRKQTRKSGHGIKGDKFRHILDLDEAHAAVSGDGEATVVVELRDIDTGDFTGPLGLSRSTHRRTLRSCLLG